MKDTSFLPSTKTIINQQMVMHKQQQPKRVETNSRPANCCNDINNDSVFLLRCCSLHIRFPKMKPGLVFVRVCFTHPIFSRLVLLFSDHRGLVGSVLVITEEFITMY